ncbi:UDP-glucose 4-epimerase [bioreactor metagenome]|uniref:UDP-glucose 4-epimerase n=1 Tax=bioreactor metagenome TaxID=1076179 RepID=A0A645J5E1_9ZZZZ
MVPLDNRDLNYANYFVDGRHSVSQSIDYTSHSTHRLNKEELKQMLLSPDYVQKELEFGSQGEGV